MGKESCYNCLFWWNEKKGICGNKEDKTVVSFCRREHPRIFQVGDRTKTMFPITPSFWWCGEYINEMEIINGENTS